MIPRKKHSFTNKPHHTFINISFSAQITLDCFPLAWSLESHFFSLVLIWVLDTKEIGQILPKCGTQKRLQILGAGGSHWEQEYIVISSRCTIQIIIFINVYVCVKDDKIWWHYHRSFHSSYERPRFPCLLGLMSLVTDWLTSYHSNIQVPNLLLYLFWQHYYKRSISHESQGQWNIT